MVPHAFSYFVEEFDPLPTAAELAELEECDAWVSQMVDLDQAERDHLIAFALSNAEEAKAAGVAQ